MSTPETAAASPEGEARLLSVFVHVGFALTGVVTTLLGPLLPWLAARWRLADSQAGALFSAEFVGSIAGVWVSGLLLTARGFVVTVLLGLGLAAGGVAVLSVAEFGAGLAAVLVFGFGLGLTGPAINLWVAETRPHRRTAALSLLNMVWALGATAAPAVVALLAAHGWLGGFLPGLALLLVVMGAAIARAARGGAVHGVEPAAPEAVLPRGLWRRPAALLFAALFFVYVGIEQALGGWAAMTAQRLAGGAAGTWAAVPAFFWGALVLGRGLAPMLLRRLEEDGLILAALGAAALGSAILLLAGSPRVVVLGVTLAGLGMAPVFPVAVAQLSHHFGGAASRIAGPLFGMGALGGAAVPWLVGLVSTHLGGLRAGLAVPLAGAVALIVVHLRLARLAEVHAAAEAPRA